MAKKQVDASETTLKALEKQLESAQDGLKTHQEREAMLRGELEAKESALRALDVELSERVEEMLKSIPATDSAQLVAGLEGFRQSGRQELSEKVLVLQTALNAERQQVARVEAEIRQVDKLIQQEVDDQAAREVHSIGLDLIERIKIANGARFRLNDAVKAVPHIRDWPDRFQRLGLKWPLSLGVLLQSHIQRANIDSLDLSRIAQLLTDIGHAYGEKPLSLPGQPNAALSTRRENYFENKTLELN